MRKIVSLLTMLILMGMLAGCGKSTELADVFDEKEVISKAENAVTVVNEGSFESYSELWDESLKSKIREKDFDEQVVPLLEKKGEFKGFGKAVVVGQKDEDSGNDYAVAIVVGEYSDGKIQFTISFDENMNMIGFFLK